MSGGSLSFPVDFFESCSLLNDVEFGGGDLLQIYNVAQLKHRLQTSGLYVASIKPAGFQMEATVNDPGQVRYALDISVLAIVVVVVSWVVEQGHGTQVKN